jgi:hypothetical protein
VPGFVALGGVGLALAGWRWIGVGVLVGACLAYLNGVVLSRRVDLAADMGDMARALLVMQLSLLLTCTVIGIATVILVKFSLAMAVASAAGFAVSHLGILGAFYWTRGRTPAALEGEGT